MTLIVIKLRGTTDFIQNYLLTLDSVAVVESDKYVRESPTIKIHVVPPTGKKEEIVESIIDGKLFQFHPQIIAVESPVKITHKMKQFLRNGGIIVVFERGPGNNIEIETINE